MFPRVTHPSAADVLLRPLDLHVLSLPPAFALSQDQTLKLDLKLLNRLITTFDEVPPYLLNAIHIADNDGVTYVNVYRRSLSSSLNCSKTQVLKLKSSSNRDSQGLRRPRFSFFIFTCQTARGPKTPLPSLEGSRRPHSTANDNRLASAVDSLILVRSLTGTKTCLGQGPRQRRAQWAVYKPAQSSLSTPVVNKSSHHTENFRGPENSRLLRTLRRT